MALFKKRTSRATRRAEARALKAKAKLEAKLEAKNEVRRFKTEQRARDKAAKAQLRAQRDSDRAALKVAEAQLKAAREGKLLSPTRRTRVGDGHRRSTISVTTETVFQPSGGCRFSLLDL